MINILGLCYEEMSDLFYRIGEKTYHATQLVRWIHYAGIIKFEKMTNLSNTLRKKLIQIAYIFVPKLYYEYKSKDGTRKFIIETNSGSFIEMVLIPDKYKNRITLCISSQSGCSIKCSFCSTGKQGLDGNLSSAEIIGQFWIAKHIINSKITNVVMMGMGEPLMNFRPLISSINIMLYKNAYCISKRRITISTSGVVPMIDLLGKYLDINLAISLHASNDAIRNTLVPINRKYNIQSLIDAGNRYLRKCSARMITIEYILIRGINDQNKHANELAKLLKKIKCKINLIQFNKIKNSRYESPVYKEVLRFQSLLYKHGYNATLRVIRGLDINAACGQLVGNIKYRTDRKNMYNINNN
ncbi:Ribosomal RNA large subunit methyltransferase N [Candidatus Johnevansia muelleri]|uniref:Dual-specificity RNA methyltransferase RlmN n=1 Tax=Candidatus Johnevansia muelleri TaxID=1495769 RepID=A0A078KE13_9GAMM|nr:Ribosomal RNA large subunit methyltransferase N [Candidatus Evansia muelleri]